ncbi:hypothetical protein GCM10007852_28340 [Agaribacter marinus]|uniref:DUF6795 domain-containing protein n=2 Tax=Agaribacter marinus TaxID=1431249 RepID=A0AA37WI78_9ALTE|nr:hypothetical protein GCM10007852_28340 [Agaribacter marinus]
MIVNWLKALIILLGITYSMSTFSSTLVLFSPVSGVVELNGEPVEGANIVHNYKWKDEVFSEEKMTDPSGEFSFPVKTQQSFFWSMFPHNPAIGQELTINYQGKSYTAWRFKKGNYELNSENDGLPLKMRCELSETEKAHDISQLSDYFGLCRLE